MQDIALLAALIGGYGLVSERLAKFWITAPMAFVAGGIAFGDAGLAVFDLDIENESVALLAEATLVLVLFADATRIDVMRLRSGYRLPARLLLIGFPLTVLAGLGLAWLVLDSLSWQEAGLVAAVLAPTDAALGAAVVNDERLPVRIRQGLNVESGLNDGLAVPVVTVFLALVVAEETGGGQTDWVEFVAEQIGYGTLIGVSVGCVGGISLRWADSRGWVEGVYRQLSTLSIAVGAFALAGTIDGNGFVAAFTAGLAFSQVARELCGGVQDFTIDEGELLAGLTFIVFGAVLGGPAINELTWQIALYVVLSLTVVRMVPVAVSMIGAGTRRETVLFLGWFGPRGLASIVFGLLVLEETDSSSTRLMFVVVAWTVLVSVIAHGISAAPWSGRLAAELDTAAQDDPSMPEHVSVAEMPLRGGGMSRLPHVRHRRDG
ncbi:MAG: sodium:proton antiporter [Acidimicrobiia bacterium]|nr:sodium:proton antiporter [Acidimicrobiia bacterium]